MQDLLVRGDASSATMKAIWSACITGDSLTVTLDVNPTMWSTITIPSDDGACRACIVSEYLRACIVDIEVRLRGRYFIMGRLDDMDDPIEQARRAMVTNLPRCMTHEPTEGDA